MIYTSYYGMANKLVSQNIKPIRISLYSPKYIKKGIIVDSIPSLYPTKDMLELDLNDEVQRNEYCDKYEAIIKKFDIQIILDLERKHQNIALMCYEKEFENCHRWDVGMLLYTNKIKVLEYPDIQYDGYANLI